MKHKRKFDVVDALASTTRWEIVEALIGMGPSPVGLIAKDLGMSLSAISHQLIILKHADIVSFKKNRTSMIYQIAKSDAGKMARKIMRV